MKLRAAAHKLVRLLWDLHDEKRVDPAVVSSAVKEFRENASGASALDDAVDWMSSTNIKCYFWPNADRARIFKDNESAQLKRAIGMLVAEFGDPFK